MTLPLILIFSFDFCRLDKCTTVTIKKTISKLGLYLAKPYRSIYLEI